MTVRIVSLLLFAIIFVAPVTAHGAPRCVMTGNWGCFGIIGVDTNAIHCKYTTFRNGDRLLEAIVERRGKSTFFRKLAVDPSYHELFIGDDSLYMMAYGMIHVVTDAFRTAYPEGVDIVPEGYSVKSTKTNNTQNDEIPLVLTTNRRQHQIKYSIRFGDDSEITGECDSQLHEPLPDTYDVQHWRHRMPKTIKTLFDVRTLR